MDPYLSDYQLSVLESCTFAQGCICTADNKDILSFLSAHGFVYSVASKSTRMPATQYSPSVSIPSEITFFATEYGKGYLSARKAVAENIEYLRRMSDSASSAATSSAEYASSALQQVKILERSYEFACKQCEEAKKDAHFSQFLSCAALLVSVISIALQLSGFFV